MYSNSAQLCRLCLETSADFVNIFEKFEDSTIASVLAKHFWFQVDNNDGMPEWVCDICWIQTKTFHHFYNRLKLRHQNKILSSVTADAIKPERNVSPTPTGEALEPENIVKCEEELDISSNADDIHLIAEDESCDADNNDSSCDKSDTRPTSDDEDQFFDEKLNNEGAIVKTPKLQTEKEKQDAEIGRFFSMRCEICSDVDLETLQKARKHYRQVHKTRGYLICCGRKYVKRCLMLDHIQHHVNPDAHRCDQCGKSYKTKQILRKHKKAHGVAHKCGVCSKTYSSAETLKYHIRDKHSAAASLKFTCDPCGKIYTTKRSLTAHMKQIHEFQRRHVCEVCGRTFKQKNDMEYHIQVEHSTTPPPKVQCDICGTWAKNQRSLQRHLKFHQEMQEAQDGKTKVLNCPICKKEVQSKRLLTSHIRRAHGERKHRCTFCDKAFKRLTNLQEHIALHTGADLYSCSYCDKTFKSNANMYSHRKKAHLADWTRDKTEKNAPPIRIC